MERTFEQTVSDLRMLLRDHDPSTTADVADGAVVYLAGNELRVEQVRVSRVEEPASV